MITIAITYFFYKQRFFQLRLSVTYLTFSWIEFQMLLMCCLIDTTIIILRHILYSVYSCPCLGLGLFISHLCFFSLFFSLIFINLIISLKQTLLFFLHLFSFCLIFDQFQSGVAYKSVAYKKSMHGS